MVRTGRGVAQLAKVQARGLDDVVVTEDLSEAVAWILDARAGQSGI